MPSTFPAKFFLFFPDRSSADPFGSYVFMRSTTTNNTVTITNPTDMDTAMPYIRKMKPTVSLKSWLGTFTIQSMIVATETDMIHMYEYKDYMTGGGTVIPVIYVDRILKRLLLPRMKRNVLILDAPLMDVSGGGFPAPAAPLLGPPVVSQRPPPLTPHVARQLLELARLKHDMCPITVEEFTAGNTAVMPCGHLFMQMAIEESFKKEPNKCPACRQIGRPTFV